MALQPMPLRGSSKAPKFEGDTIDLTQFLKDVEMLCKDTEIDTPAKKIKWACHYTSHNEAKLWVTLPAQQGNDWDTFIKEVKAFYPGAEDDDHKYMHADLDGLVIAQVAVPMTSQGMLSEYIQNFTCIASFLEKRKKISQGEQEVKFLNGFHPHIQDTALEQINACISRPLPL
ncbi:hypothetical protein ID866_8151 [Astraeus odoratus]|nr:hypothetical protein ID866_8151 [Astraeus odoratus]